MKKATIVLILFLSVFVIPDSTFANPKLNLELVVIVSGRHSGRPMGGVEVNVIDEFGFSNYVHKLREYTDENGAVSFKAQSFKGFDMHRGRSWNTNKYNPRLGGQNKLKIRIEVEGKVRHLEITSERKYTVNIEI
ncbi:hypothetical protein ACFL03_10760 [Thermodesulfobacteriota bacterium]